MMQIIKYRGLAYGLSLILLIAAIASLAVWGIKYGIDFNGGSLLEVEFKGTRPAVQTVEQSLAQLNLGYNVIQPTGGNGMILRFKDVDESTHQAVVKKLADLDNGKLTEKRFESVGPIVGAELKSRALWAIAVALFFIVSYIAWAFRKVSHPVASWKYGVAAIIALAHDVVVTTGVFSILGHFKGIEVDMLFVSAILTVIGFSVHDTIVVFDRIRENIFRHAAVDFTTTVNKSVNDTLARSINTSLTTLLVLLALFILGGETIRYFALALIIGITLGTYSSIFVASPILVDWNRLNQKPVKAKK
ncbi:MAG: protein translocase subunit SecF [Candidatus Kerfeldbacteria bacterium]|nr:protein translocase subunit SecF [Candidatus Kerfeldbacteria bacterium]